MDYEYYAKIEDYLHGEMTQEEKVHFETALSSDEELAIAFNMYRTIEAEMRGFEKYRSQENALKNTLQSLEKNYFEYESPQSKKIIPLYSSKVFQLTAALAASITLLLVTYFGFYEPKNNIQLLADTYFKENLQRINQTMSDPEDTLQFGIAGNKIKKIDPVQYNLQTGITAYNNQEYNKALRYFQEVYKNHSEYSTAQQYTGLTLLATKEHDKALQVFDELAKMKDAQSNPGLFLKAITYMQRNLEGDKQKAQQLLQQVVNDRAEGNKEAEELLKKF